MRIRTTRDLAMMVREARIVSHLTQADLAEMLGVSRAWVIRLEKGAPGIHLGMTLRAMRTLGLETTVRFTQIGEAPELGDELWLEEELGLGEARKLDVWS